MRLLADESCDFAVVRALRGAGHDVVAICEISPRAEDSDVVDLAVSQGRIVLTEDKDFGQLVYDLSLVKVHLIWRSGRRRQKLFF